MRKFGLITILLMMVSIMLVACGSDEPEAPAASTTSKPAAQPAAQPAASSTSAGQTLEEYAAEHAGGPGAIYVGDFNQLVGMAPHEDFGGFEGEVPLDAIEEHAWIFESEYYKSLPETAKLNNPTELSNSVIDVMRNFTDETDLNKIKQELLKPDNPNINPVNYSEFSFVKLFIYSGAI